MSSATENATKTKRVLLWTYLLSEPLVCLFGLFSVILVKDLGATALQIAVFTMLKPTVSVISYFWTSIVGQRGNVLIQNLVKTTYFSALPFFFLYFFDNVWLAIACSLIYMIFSRAQMPFLMELFKRNVAKESREKSFGSISMFAYAEGVILSLVIGMTLDHNHTYFKELFVLCSILILIVGLLQRRLHVTSEPEECAAKKTSHPLKETIALLKRRKDFARFQFGFMISMIGLMFAMPAIPFFLSEQGHSYTTLMAAFSICKGCGFVAAMPFWTKWMEKASIERQSLFVCVGFGLFYLLLALSVLGPLWLFASYLLYGIVQAASHMLWHLSGPAFANNEESTPYSAVNVLMVGVRGIIVPPLGAYFFECFGAVATLIVGMALCLLGGLYFCLRARDEVSLLEPSQHH
ncbi:MAG: MFS transporter [Verrucomicrobia bacterium]|nr:MFS transporter [Verrucomicrobiota bacterium]